MQLQKKSKYTAIFLLINNETQCVPLLFLTLKFMTYAPSFILGTLRREIFACIYLRESFFFLVFRVDLTSWIGYPRIFCEDLFSRILVLSMFYIFWFILIFSWFLLQVVVCESRNSYPNFSIFQIPLFGCNRLNSRLFDVL